MGARLPSPFFTPVETPLRTKPANTNPRCETLTGTYGRSVATSALTMLEPVDTLRGSGQITPDQMTKSYPDAVFVT